MPVVPAEATEAMLKAWYEAQCSANPAPIGAWSRWAAWEELPPQSVEQMRVNYRAMLAAAPEPEEG
jgi:hypothetical protein